MENHELWMKYLSPSKVVGAGSGEQFSRVKETQQQIDIESNNRRPVSINLYNIIYFKDNN